MAKMSTDEKKSHRNTIFVIAALLAIGTILGNKFPVVDTSTHGLIMIFLLAKHLAD